MRYGSMLGYRKGADGKPEIVPEKAETVREIFRGYLDGMSLSQIADALNLRGVTTKLKGSDWKGANILNILKNEKYRVTRTAKGFKEIKWRLSRALMSLRKYTTI